MPTLSNPDVPDGAPAFIPLEANPQLLTSLVHKLGLSSSLAFHDVYSLTDPDLLAFVPRPALVLLLVFPVSATYENHRVAEDALAEEYKGGEGKQGDSDVIWIKQTIRNACGLMGVLHGVLNGAARGFIEPNSTLSELLHKLPPLLTDQRSQLLEQTSELKTAHQDAATAGDTPAPEATAHIDLHYVCFIKTADGKLWELDGRRRGPIVRGELGTSDSDDVLSEMAIAMGPGKFLEREGKDLRFSCVALGGSVE